ncbi:MAG: sugar phosphate isomerase/epimerase, partial [Deltaproteobacteria bacterium]
MHIPVLKNSFGFRLATTSYIIPEGFMKNISFLGRYVDEIALVLFDTGNENNLPSKTEIREMKGAAEEFNITYNVHLPPDVFLGDPDPAVREVALQRVLCFYDRTLPLGPVQYVLHLDRRGADGRPLRDWDAFTANLLSSMDELIKGGLDASSVSVENLDFPLQWVEPVVEEFGMNFCLDLGHLMYYCFDLKENIDAFLDRSPIVHLHGIADGMDHKGAENIDEASWG